MEVLLHLARAMNRCETPSEIYEPALDAVRDLLGAERSAILLFDESGRMRFQAWRGLSDSYRAAVDGHSPWSPEDRDAGPILIADVTTGERVAAYRSIFAAERIGAIGFVPLFSRELLGKFMLYWQRPRTFSEHDEALAVAIASQIAEALGRARSREAEQAAHDRLAQLYGITSILNAAATPDTITTSLPLVCAVIAATTGGVTVLSADGRDLEVIGTFGASPEVVEYFRRHSVESNVATAESIRTRQPIYIESRAERDRRYGHVTAKFPDHFEGTAVVIPLLVEDRAIGTISFGFSSWRAVTSADRTLLLAVAGQYAQALDRARLLNAERSARAEAEAAEVRRAFLAEASAALAKSLDYDLTLRNVAQLAVPRFADWSAVDMAAGPEGETTRVAVVHGDPTKVELAHELRRQYPPDPAAPRGVPHVLRTGVAELYREIPDEVLVTNARDADHLRIMRELGMKSAMAVPIVASGRTLGVISFVTAESQRRYDDEDLRLAVEIGRRAGVAIENARVFEALRLAEEKLQVALSAGRMGVWEWSIPTGRVTWSPTLEQIHGLEPGTFPGTFDGYQGDVHPDDREQLFRSIQETVATGRDHHVEYRIVLPDGRERWVAGHGNVVARAGGRPISMMGVCMDITETKVAEQALRDSEERYRTLFAVSVYGVITIDEAGVIERANPATERIFGYSAAELVGRNVSTLMPDPYRSEHEHYLQNYLRTGVRKIIGIGREVVGQRKDGTRFPMDLAVSEFHVGGKRHFKGLVNDITQRKELERAREAAVAELEEALRANEMFAAVLAHDLRNPLAAILTATELMLHRLQPEKPESALSPLRRVMVSGERMTRMIDQLLDFTRSRVGGGFELDRRDADLARLCALVIGEVELAHPEWKVKVESLGDFHGTWDTDRLLQAVSNLVTNAGQHGSSGSGILVKVDGTAPDSVTLEVHNDGCIPEALVPTIFAPFRGTRQRGAGGGLGLGLYITKEIVRSHGGTVDVTTSESAGTTFRVTLPRSARRAAATT